MHNYIKKLQSKNENTRKQILIVSMVVSMVVVGSVWIYGLSTRFGPQTVAKVNEDVKPFKLFGDSLAETYKNISASVGNISSISSKNNTPEGKVIELIPVEQTN
jgi:hypothetical protein